MGVYFCSLVFGFTLITISLGAMLYQIRRYKISDNISYFFVTMNIISSSLLFFVALFSQRWMHLGIFMIYLVESLMLIYYKYKFDSIDQIPDWMIAFLDKIIGK